MNCDSHYLGCVHVKIGNGETGRIMAPHLALLASNRADEKTLLGTSVAQTKSAKL